jgi:membrane-associated phospholipid phosphatase
MLINISSIYDLISILALVANIYIYYTLDCILIFGSIICLFLHDFIKELTTGWYAPVFKRPDGAMNCSLFNTGGLVDHKSGFPSGHVTSISYLMNMLWLRSENNGWINMVFYNFPIVLMGYARIMKGCHNLIQVIAGYLLGYIVANTLYNHQTTIYKYLQTVQQFISKSTKTKSKNSIENV